MKFQYKKNVEDNAGLYLIGINLPEVFKSIKDEINFNLSNMDYPGKYKTKEERLKAQELQKLKKLKRENEKNKRNKGKSSFDLTGEYIDQDYEVILKDILGIRRDLTDLLLQPHNVLTRESTFLDIITEAKKYQREDTRELSPKALLTMVKILFKTKKNALQWIRVATLCETIYQYFGLDQNRQQFFSSIRKLDETLLVKLEEFWKTDWIFRSNKERQDYKELLNFYK